MPGQAAYVDESRGRSSMRLNFSGVSDEEIREGVRRIGKAIAEQVDLYGALTSDAASDDEAVEVDASPAEPARAEEAGGDVLPFRKAGEGTG